MGDEAVTKLSRVRPTFGVHGARLHRYWFTFEGDARSLRAGLAMGVGVTAFDRDDAARIIRRDVLEGQELPTVAHVIEDVDVSTLDPNHVLPNAGPPSVRGVWFPLGATPRGRRVP